jgi:glycosyltransferase involved in cell wall biosynthesis
MKPSKGQNQQPIRVAFIHRKPRPLGNFSIETYFQQIREHLPAPYEPIYVEMPFESNGLWRRLANAIYCAFKQGDINHITGDVNYVASLLKKRKTILTLHDLGRLHETSGIKRRILKLFWYTIPFSKTSYLTANSQATKNDIIQLTDYNAEKIPVIHICINQSFQFNIKAFNQENPRILHIGTAPNKNLNRLIIALKNINCTLVIIGKINSDIKSLIKEHQITTECHENRLTDLEILYQYEKCDILSMVSTFEGFGMPIIEANAVGRAVICGNTSSMPEIAKDSALMIDPYKVDEITDGFKKLINDEKLRNNLIKNGLQNHLRFQPKQLATSYATLYDKINKNGK